MTFSGSTIRTRAIEPLTPMKSSETTVKHDVHCKWEDELKSGDINKNLLLFQVMMIIRIIISIQI